MLIDGRVVKHRGTPFAADVRRARQLVEESLEYLRSVIPNDDWDQAMNAASVAGAPPDA